METKEKIKRLRAQIAKLQEHLKNSKGAEKAEIQKHIDKYQSQLDALLAENPHNDGSGRPPIPPKKTSEKTSDECKNAWYNYYKCMGDCKSQGKDCSGCKKPTCPDPS